MKEIIIAVLSLLLGGGTVAAIIGATNDRWKLKFQRQAAKEDRAEEKADKAEAIDKELSTIQQDEAERNRLLETRLKGMENQLNAQSEALRLILLDRILQFGEQLVDVGEVTFEERKRFHQMHKCYHDGLEGNGDADLLVNAVDQLPLKHGGSETCAD